MNYESKRLETFVSWPKQWIDVNKLAENGFYYVGPEDKVKCQFCNLKLHKFDAEDTIIDPHLKHNPTCFQRNHRDNIPLKRSKAEIIKTKEKLGKIKQYFDKLQIQRDDRECLDEVFPFYKKFGYDTVY